MSWPNDLCRIMWKPGEIHMEGGEPYLMPFGQHDLKQLEENKVS